VNVDDVSLGRGLFVGGGGDAVAHDVWTGLQDFED
jgi:hypothetical protein